MNPKIYVRSGKEVREMSDSYRCSSTHSENMLEKITQIYSQLGKYVP